MAPLQPEREAGVPVGAAPDPVPFQHPAQGGHVPSGPGRAAGWRLEPPGPVGTIRHAHTGGSAWGDPAPSRGGLPADAGHSRSPFLLTSLVGFIFRGALVWQTNLLERMDRLPPQFPNGLQFRAPEEPLSSLSALGCYDAFSLSCELECSRGKRGSRTPGSEDRKERP